MTHSEYKRDIRMTVDMDELVYMDIDILANQKRWSFSYTCYVLLQQALKEKNRKKKKPVPNGSV